MALHRVHAVVLGLWRFGLGAVSFQEFVLLYLLKIIVNVTSACS